MCVALIETTTKTLKQIVYNTYVYAYAVFSRRIQIADFSFPNQFYSVRNARSRFRLSVRKRRANDIRLYGLDAFRAKRFIVIENYVREWTNEMYYGVDVVRIPHVRDFACRGSEKLLTLCVVPNAYHLCVCTDPIGLFVTRGEVLGRFRVEIIRRLRDDHARIGTRAS